MTTNKITAALETIFANQKPADYYREIEESGYQHFVLRVEKMLLNLVDKIELALFNFDEDAWFTIVEGGRVSYITKGRGIYLQDGVYALAYVTKDGVSIRIQDGLELAKSLELKTILFAYATNENLARAMKAKFDEFKKDGITDITIQFEDFKYTNR